MFAVDVMVLDRLLQLFTHVADGKYVNQGADERHHHEHEGGEAVDAETELQGRAAPGIVGDSWKNAQPVGASGPAKVHRRQRRFFVGDVLFDGLAVAVAGDEFFAEFVDRLLMPVAGLLLVAVHEGENEEPREAEQEGEADGRRGDVGGAATALVAAEKEVEPLDGGMVVAVAAAERPRPRRQQDQHERQQRQQRRRDEQPAGVGGVELVGVGEEFAHGYPLSSSAVSTSTVV